MCNIPPDVYAQHKYRILYGEKDILIYCTMCYHFEIYEFVFACNGVCIYTSIIVFEWKILKERDRMKMLRFNEKKTNTLLKKNNSDPSTLQHVFNFEKSFKDLETNEEDVVWENCF